MQIMPTGFCAFNARIQNANSVKKMLWKQINAILIANIM